MKSPVRSKEVKPHCVAPLVGAWIEISSTDVMASGMAVAPLVGAWIEMPWWERGSSCKASLPLWERGLKYVNISIGGLADRRSPRGSVD